MAKNQLTGTLPYSVFTEGSFFSGITKYLSICKIAWNIKIILRLLLNFGFKYKNC